MENTSSINPLIVEIMAVDLGLKYTVISAVDILAGLKMHNVLGSLYSTATNLDFGIMAYGGGVKYNIQQGAYLAATYTLTNIVDNLDTTGSNDFAAQEIDINLEFSF